MLLHTDCCFMLFTYCCWKLYQVLLTGLADAWPARHTWTLDHLLQNYGDTAFKISQRSSRKISMTFKDYVSYMKVQHDEDPLYIFDHKVLSLVVNTLFPFLLLMCEVTYFLNSLERLNLACWKITVCLIYFKRTFLMFWTKISDLHLDGSLLGPRGLVPLGMLIQLWPVPGIHFYVVVKGKIQLLVFLFCRKLIHLWSL